MYTEGAQLGQLHKQTWPSPGLLLAMAFVQARWVAQVLSGKAVLPNEVIMLRELEAFYKLRASHGVPVRYTHCQVNCLRSAAMLHLAVMSSILSASRDGKTRVCEAGLW